MYCFKSIDQHVKTKQKLFEAKFLLQVTDIRIIINESKKNLN